jgi:hypothetical protein
LVSQQPPLHGCDELQRLVHWCATGSQAIGDGQSAATLQPQVPPTHWWPFGEAVQSRQTPDEPHAFAEVPVTQELPEQQPPVQLPSPIEPQWLMQPAAEQVGVSPLQVAQAPPLAPQAPGRPPKTHTPFSQQPPLHAAVALHFCVQ